MKDKENVMRERNTTYYCIDTPGKSTAFLQLSVETSYRTGCRQMVLIEPDREILELVELFENAYVYVVVPTIESARRNNIPARVHTVIWNWETDDLAAALLANGYDMTRKGLFIWIGRSSYFRKETIGEIIRSLAVVAADGSALVMDYIDEGLAASPSRRMTAAVALEAATGKAVKSTFTYASLELLLEKFGFIIYEQLTAEAAGRFGGAEQQAMAYSCTAYVHAVWKG